MGGLQVLLVIVISSVLIYGYVSPSSIPGKFLWGFLDMLGMAGDNYKAKNAMANYRGSLARRKQSMNPGLESIGEVAAEIASYQRILAKKMSDADKLELKLNILDEDGVSDDDKTKLDIGAQLLQLQSEIEDLEKDIKNLGGTKIQFTEMLVAAKNEVLKGERESERLEGQLKRSEVEVELERQKQTFALTGHDTTSQAKELVEKQIERNKGRASAYRDVLGTSDDDAALDKRVADRQTADFLAKRRQKIQAKTQS